MTYGIELTPSHDRKKSFYGKAIVFEIDGKKELVSYNTNVAEIENGKARVFNVHSQTTLRHIKEFLKQNGFKAETSKQIWNDYGIHKETEIDSSGLRVKNPPHFISEPYGLPRELQPKDKFREEKKEK